MKCNSEHVHFAFFERRFFESDTGVATCDDDADDAVFGIEGKRCSEEKATPC